MAKNDVFDAKEQLARERAESDAQRESQPNYIAPPAEQPKSDVLSEETQDQLSDKLSGADDKEKRRRRIGAIIIAALMLVVIVFIIVGGARPLDKIHEYNVHVAPQENGELLITYDIVWEVLNDSREGPLEWVQFGLANNSYELVDYGGALSRPKSADDVYLIAFYLDHNYYKGDIVHMRFTLRQSRMLCHNPETPPQPYYDFTPGWFEDIKVDHYRFSWENSDYIVDHNADSVQGGELVWEGSFGKGEKRGMELSYSETAFSPDVRQVDWQDYGGGGSASGGEFNAVGILYVLLFGGLGLYWTLVPKEQRANRNYGGGRYYGGGSSGGCACACAGCACACACAGGGRAGCTTKDFYATGNPYSQTCRKLTRDHVENGKEEEKRVDSLCRTL